MAVEETTSYLTSPDLGLLVWTLWVFAMLPLAGVTLSKRRFGWFWAGFVTMGLAWTVGCAQIASPSSVWARRFYGPVKQERAIVAYLRAGAIDR